MQNPFAYSNLVTGNSFCNRRKEQDRLLQYIQSSQNVLIYSHRRYGKSSLIFQVFENIKNKKLKMNTLYIDLYGTLSEKDFITRAFQALNQLESNFDKLLKLLTTTLKGFRVNVSVDPKTGNPSVSPSFSGLDEKIVLSDLMKILESYSEKQKIAVAFDEFQEVSNYSEESFEKRLRSCIQQHKNICYIFSGSQQHILTDMFNASSRAFYKQAESLPLANISTKDYLPWINGLFLQKDVHLEVEFIKEIVERFENHPMYIQNFLFHLWNEVDHHLPTKDLADRLEAMILKNKHIEYVTLWEPLTVNQKKTLKLILLTGGKNMYSVDSLKAAELKSASLVTKALSSLVKKEIVVKNGAYAIQDVLFIKWLKSAIEV